MTTTKTFRPLLLVCLFVATLLAMGASGQATREDILASREKRRNQLERVLVQAKKKLADHYSGADIMEQHRVDHFEHKIGAYAHQIEELDRELDEDEIQARLERAERVRLERLEKEERRRHTEL